MDLRFRQHLGFTHHPQTHRTGSPGSQFGFPGRVEVQIDHIIQHPDGYRNDPLDRRFIIDLGEVDTGQVTYCRLTVYPLFFHRKDLLTPQAVHRRDLIGRLDDPKIGGQLLVLFA